MKFENIKVGDTVFISEYVNYGWRNAEDFWIPKKVDRITKTQFILDNGKRFKKDGREIGDSWSEARSEGEKYRRISSIFETVTDQTEEMNKFKIRINTERNIRDQFGKLNLEFNSSLTVEQVEKVQELVNELNEILKLQ